MTWHSETSPHKGVSGEMPCPNNAVSLVWCRSYLLPSLAHLKGRTKVKIHPCVTLVPVNRRTVLWWKPWTGCEISKLLQVSHSSSNEIQGFFCVSASLSIGKVYSEQLSHTFICFLCVDCKVFSLSRALSLCEDHLVSCRYQETSNNEEEVKSR